MQSSDASLLWQLIGIASVLGNVVWVWIRIRSRNNPMLVGPSPLEVTEWSRPVSREEFAQLTRRVERIEAEAERNLREIVEEIIKLRENNHKQFQELQRAIGRLEGGRINV